MAVEIASIRCVAIDQISNRIIQLSWPKRSWNHQPVLDPLLCLGPDSTSVRWGIAGRSLRPAVSPEAPGSPVDPRQLQQVRRVAWRASATVRVLVESRNSLPRWSKGRPARHCDPSVCLRLERWRRCRKVWEQQAPALGVVQNRRSVLQRQFRQRHVSDPFPPLACGYAPCRS